MRRMTITFGEYDEDVETFLKNQKNASALVRHLVRNYMNNTNIPYNGQVNQSDNRVNFENLLNLMVGNMVGNMAGNMAGNMTNQSTNESRSSKEEEEMARKQETIEKVKEIVDL